MMDDGELRTKARRLAAVIEPFAGQVYFAPKCHAAYAQLGFSVFNPSAVVPASTALPVAGKPLYAGVLAQAVPPTPLGAAWRFADRLREYRGDAHTAAWTSAGFDAVEIGLLTELYWGLPRKTYIRSRAWPAAELDGGIGRLEERDLVRDGALTGRGRQAREAVESCTDRQCRPVIESLGDDFDDVVSVLAPMGRQIRALPGYPASGPHDLAGRLSLRRYVPDAPPYQPVSFRIRAHRPRHGRGQRHGPRDRLPAGR